MTTDLPPHEAAARLDSVAAQIGGTPEVLAAAQDALAEVYRAHGAEDAAAACDRMAVGLTARAQETARAEWEALPRHVRARIAITPTAWIQRRTDLLAFEAADLVRAALERAAPEPVLPAPSLLPLAHAA